MMQQPPPRLNPDKALYKLCHRRFYYFFCEFWDTIEAEPLALNWHIEVICDWLQEIYEKWAAGIPQDDALLNVPPGSSKSTIVTQLFPAWIWVKRRQTRIITASYAADLATAHAVKTRDILMSAKFKRVFGWRHIVFKHDTNGKTHYKNIHQGERLIASPGGMVTGFHAHFLIWDDLINPQQAASKDELRKASQFDSQTLSSRKVDKGLSVSIGVMQRLDEMDPAGVWLKDRSINHMCLPGELGEPGDVPNVKPAHLIANYVDGLMDIHRMTRRDLQIMKKRLGSYGYANQVRQVSAPQKGGVWQKWFIPVDDHLMPPISQMTKHGTDWDTAYTDNTDNAASAHISSGMYQGKMYITGAGAGHYIFPELIKEMRRHPEPHYIEAKASGKSAKQTLGAAPYFIAAIEVEVPSDKEARAKSATPKAEAGMVCVARSLLDFIYNDENQGILKFPKGPKADLADTLAQAIIRHFGRGIVLHAKRY